MSGLINTGLLQTQSNDVDTILSNINQYNYGVQQQASDVLLGGALQSQGYQIAANGYRQASQLVGQANAFNLDVTTQNTATTLNNLAVQYRQLVGVQQAQQAGSGFSSNSESFQLAQNEAFNTATSTLTQVKTESENQRRSDIFTTQIQQNNLLNQAKAADFQSQVSNILAGRKANQLMQGAQYQTNLIKQELTKDTGSFF